MSYTDDEVTAAIEKLVRTSIRRQQGALGNRDLSLTFNDYMDAAAGVFILFQNSPFYVLWLGARRLREALQTQRDAIGDFIDLVTATGRYTTPVNNLSPLVNARVALTELEGVAAQRSSSFENIEESSAYRRFESNTQRFLSESGKNIKSGGDIVRTPEEARGLLAPSFTSLKEGVEDVVRRVGVMEGAIADFSSLDLPATLSSSIIANAKGVLDSWYDALNELTPKQRLGILRDTVLDVLAARSTVKGFGSLTPPTTFLILDGEGGLYSDSTHEAAPASILSETYGPYPILSNNELYFTAEDQGLTVAVQPSFVPFLESTVYGPYEMYQVGDVNGTPNNELRVTLRNHDGYGTSQNIDVTFLAGDDPTTLQAWEVALGFNNAVQALDPDLPVVMEPYCNPIRFNELVTMTFSSPYYVFTAVNPLTDFAALGVVVGDHIIITDPDANNYRAIYRVDGSGVSGGVVTCAEVYHPASYLAETVDISVTGGSDALPVRIRVSDERDGRVPVTGGYAARPDHRLAALLDRMSIEFPNSGFTDHVATLTSPSVDLTALSLPGDVAGLSMIVEVDSLGPQVVDLTGFSGTTVGEVLTAIEAQLIGVTVGETGGSPSYITFTYSGPTDSSSRRLSLVSGSLLTIIYDPIGTPPYTDEGMTPSAMQFQATSSLGFYIGSVATARKTTASEVANSLNVAAASSWNGVKRVSAAAEFSATVYSGRGRTDPFDWLKVVCSKFEQKVVTATSLGGNSYSFVLEGALSAGVETADVLVIRASSASADVGLVGSITAVSDTSVEATFTQALVGGLTDLDIEIGPDLSAYVFDGPAYGAQAVIANSPANDGTYTVIGQSSTIPFELTVDAPMPYPQPGGALPNVYDLEVGYSKVRFSSLDATTATYLFMDDGGGNTQSTYATFFPSSSFVEAVGSTPHFQLPVWPKNIEEGDILELYYYENAILHSEEFDHPYWTLGGVTVTPDTAPGPFPGTLAADMVEDTGASRHEVVLTGVPRGEYVLQRIHVQAAGRSIATIRGNNPWGGAWFDLTTKAVALSTNWNVDTTQAKIEELEDGWFRCTVLRKMSTPSGVTVHTCGASDSMSGTSYTGSGTTALRIWGSQVATTKAFNTYTKASVTPMTRDTNPVTLPGYSSPILALEQTSKLIELTSAFPTDLPPYVFTRDTPFPFARIRKQGLNNYELMRAELEAWLETPEAQPAYFTELQRLLNPLSVNLNPTAVEVNGARLELQALDSSLEALDGYLAAYTATAVPQIDTLVSTLLEKGGDRAVDILLEGQFSTFFGMDQDDLSYAGTVQKGIKEVMRNDLPQRKDNRLGRFAAEDVSIGEYEEPDFEYDFSDIDDSPEPDIPAGNTFDL